MSDQVAEIKSRIDLPQLIGERVPLKQRGRRFIALCPFHSEKTPSFTVSPDLGIFKCFGCGAAGDAFTFLERFDGMTFPEALEYLADRVGVKLERRTVDERVAQEDRKILEVHHLAAEYFHFLLTEHARGEKARVYLKKRGVKKESIDQFFLGYALDRWDGLLTFLTKKGYEGELLEKAGLVIRRDKRKAGSEKQREESKDSLPSRFTLHASDFYDRFRGRVMFPLRDIRGQVVGFAGRLLDPNVKDPSADSGRGAKYINSPETPIYHKGKHLYGIFENRDAIRKEDRAVLVEGELDAISSWQTGVKHVIAVKGTAVTEDQVKLLRRMTRNITMALDTDKAGWEALKRGLPILETHGMNVRVTVLPKDTKDPDELARRDALGWRKLVAEARNVYDALVLGTIDRIGAESGEQKKHASEVLVPILAGITNPVEQDHWIRDVSNLLGAREESVRRQVEVYQRTGVSSMTPVRQETRGDTNERHAQVLGKYLLALLVQSGAPLPPEVDLAWVEPIGVRRILEQWRQTRVQKDLNIRHFRNSLPEELRALLDDAALSSILPDTSTEDRWLEQELSEVVRNIEREWVKKALTQSRSDPQRLAAFTKRLKELERPD